MFEILHILIQVLKRMIHNVKLKNLKVVSHHKKFILVVVMFLLIVHAVSMFDCLCINNMHVDAFSFGKIALLKYSVFKICGLFNIVEQSWRLLMASTSCILGAVPTWVQLVLLNI